MRCGTVVAAFRPTTKMKSLGVLLSSFIRPSLYKLHSKHLRFRTLLLLATLKRIMNSYESRNAYRAHNMTIKKKKENEQQKKKNEIKAENIFRRSHQIEEVGEHERKEERKKIIQRC